MIYLLPAILVLTSVTMCTSINNKEEIKKLEKQIEKLLKEKDKDN